MRLDYTDRHVVVTGGTGALGTAVVEALLEHGATCHVTCVEPPELERFPHRDHERVRIYADTDLRVEDVVVALYGGLESVWASIHIAGGFAMTPFAETSLDSWRHLFEMNAQTCFLACREAVKAMRRSGGQGRIVNVGARPALVPTGGMVAYAASKAAVASLTECLSEELGPEGIFVNAVMPSIIRTSANVRAMPGADHDKWPTPGDIARSIAFLASPDNTCTRGGLVPVYGRS